MTISSDTPSPSRPTPGHPDHDRLLERLEASYEFHTQQLARLTEYGHPESEDPLTHASLTAASRQALTVIAAALRDMADGRYGICDGCGDAIPFERLEARPEARFCVTCQVAAAR